MMIKNSIVLLFLLASLNGCAKDYSLAPPSDSEQITITVKVPKKLEAETMQVMYRSAICKRITHGASGQTIELEGYHGIDVELQRKGESDLYEAQLSINGGGACQWRLSNAVFGVAYRNPTSFGEGVRYGAGGGIVVKFDKNRASRSYGSPIKVDGDLRVEKDYYPWVDEEFLGTYKKTVNLTGEGNIYLMYEALRARKVYFEPVLHSDFVVHSAGPKVKRKGNYTTFIYPDATVIAEARSKPDFRKLQAIRLAAESQK